MPEEGDDVSWHSRAATSGVLSCWCPWSANAPPPESADQASTVKTIRSRSGTTIRLVDNQANARVVVETPGGQRLVLQDSPGSVHIEDANGNALTFSPSGITINASATVSVSSSNVEVNAGLVNVNAGMSRFSGVVQCDTLIANSVVGATTHLALAMCFE